MKKFVLVMSLWSFFGFSALAQTPKSSDPCIDGRLSKICPGDEVAFFPTAYGEATNTDFSVGIYKGRRDYHPASPYDDDGAGYAEVHLYYHFGTTHLQAERLFKIVHTCVYGFCPGQEYVFPKNYRFRVQRIFENADAYIEIIGGDMTVINLAAMSRRIAYENSSASNVFPLGLHQK